MWLSDPNNQMPKFHESCSCCQKIKVICIIGDYQFTTDTSVSFLTKNKIYDAIDMEYQLHVYPTTDYNLIADDGFRSSYPKSYFMTLAEWRQLQIDEILD